MNVEDFNITEEEYLSIQKKYYPRLTKYKNRKRTNKVIEPIVINDGWVSSKNGMFRLLDNRFDFTRTHFTEWEKMTRALQEKEKYFLFNSQKEAQMMLFLDCGIVEI